MMVDGAPEFRIYGCSKHQYSRRYILECGACRRRKAIMLTANRF
jgi:hypothetical protein